MELVYSLPVIGKPSFKFAEWVSSVPRIWKERVAIYALYIALMAAMPRLLNFMMDLGLIR
ncbi:hypothetical protein HQ393_14295 [Chitinibacter bivalviorum]|uniref:Uncharacterized protein n=1 Tax=Chitinibacter bivalviorum TaxID=2739434 RepID=A0A7H9BKW9_9NEIS|nr:hypothetical protein [Chitinibacter bivalviorum]QLG89320.1 hypothetical protein HQ393_14295 [Chitinibacter bivalviorum]